jgi:ubiquitin-protein ligase
MTNSDVSTETIKRLLTDIKEIMKSPLTSHGIYYEHNEIDMLKGQALIIGPKDTPYEGGYYLFEFLFPTNYPYSPPKITYCTNDGVTRFNPNFYKCGKVCLSILNTWRGEQWSSCQSISTVLLALCTTLNEQPLLNEPGITENSEDLPKYNAIIRYKNLEIATLYMLQNEWVHKQFPIFLPIMKTHFLSSYEKKIEFIDKEIAKNISTPSIKTNIYIMYVIVDYVRLKQNFINYYNSIKEC